MMAMYAAAKAIAAVATKSKVHTALRGPGPSAAIRMGSDRKKGHNDPEKAKAVEA
jgi:hypothetical protein